MADYLTKAEAAAAKGQELTQFAWEEMVRSWDAMGAGDIECAKALNASARMANAQGRFQLAIARRFVTLARRHLTEG